MICHSVTGLNHSTWCPDGSSMLLRIVELTSFFWPRNSPWVGKIPWRRKWQPTPQLLPWKSYGQRSLVQATIHGVAKSRAQLSDFPFTFSLLYGPAFTYVHDYWKNNSLTIQTFVGKVTSLLDTRWDICTNFVAALPHIRKKLNVYWNIYW